MTVSPATLTPIAARPPVPELPMTHAAWQALADELAELTGPPAPPNVHMLPTHGRAERVEQLRDVLAVARVEPRSGRAVIGRRVRIREAEGQVETYALVIPGDGDPFHGWLSVDAPMGAALLGACAGDRVEVKAPSGARPLWVLDVM
jgi:regulator of nucleoside diphosphate kinase